MGRTPCCDKANVKRGPWSPDEDAKLKHFIEKHGTANWIALPHKAGLKRCGKSCRLRWLNYLRPNIKHGEFSPAEDRIICSMYATTGSRWSIIAAQLPGRTDNDIKNYWNTKLKKKLLGITPPQRNSSYQQQQMQLQLQQQQRGQLTSFILVNTPWAPLRQSSSHLQSLGQQYQVKESTDLLMSSYEPICSSTQISYGKWEENDFACADRGNGLFTGAH